MSDTWASLAEALTGVPKLPGARCRGRSLIWDETEDREVVEYAQNQCLACPALAACREWAATQKRLTGVVAGCVHFYHQINREAAA